MTRVVSPSDASIEEAARLLQHGDLVAFPTETVYGLGAVATNDRAVAGIFRAKGRPAHNPLIVHVIDTGSARVLAQMSEPARRLADAFWPGPLTLVLPKAEGCPVSRAATAGLTSIAVRVPAHPVARALLQAVMLPVVAPSANPSGRVSPTTARHVADDLGDALTLVLDGGACPVGLESTVVDLTGMAPRLLRPGGLGREQLEEVVGPMNDGDDGSRPRSPGQLASHYAPRLRLRLDATEADDDEALLAFGPMPPSGRTSLNLSPSADLGEAARNLFAMLRALDVSGAVRIAVAPIPGEGLGEAIRDRLKRAAAPRT